MPIGGEGDILEASVAVPEHIFATRVLGLVLRYVKMLVCEAEETNYIIAQVISVLRSKHA